MVNKLLESNPGIDLAIVDTKKLSPVGLNALQRKIKLEGDLFAAERGLEAKEKELLKLVENNKKNMLYGNSCCFAIFGGVLVLLLLSSPSSSSTSLAEA
jgi:hypothetical protein